jgi:hypothetical protein
MSPLRGAFVGNMTGEQPSAAEQRLRHYARTSRKYLLFSILALVAWLIIGLIYVSLTGGPEPDRYIKGVPGSRFGTVLVNALFLLTSFAGLTFNILAIAAGMKARRYGNIWVLMALLESPITAYLFLGSLWLALGWAR